MTYIPLSSLELGRDLEEIEAELARFEADERARLGLPGDDRVDHYVERRFEDPRTANRDTTTILLSGLTLAQDHFVEAALGGLGYTVQSLDCPDNEALQLGKEFGNRAQCNPTYYTVGNLVKHLQHLRDVEGLQTAEIIDRFVFLTAGSCGPCRFGMYVTEYRKALRDAGFEGFRVLVFVMNGGIKQAAGDEQQGLVFNPRFFLALAQSLLAGDALNVIGYRLRPYEVVAGATDRALEDAKAVIQDAFRARKSLVRALLRARRILARVELDRTIIKPKVSLLGEFWAMTTEGDGSYRMQRFLEEEGAEVDIQTVTQWIKYMAWEALRDTNKRAVLRRDDGGRKGLEGKDPFKKAIMIRVGGAIIESMFWAIGRLLGVHGYKLPNIQHFADIAEDFYNHDVRGGEAFLEVAKVISNVVQRKVDMTISIKPFGCMPSSGVSDGVQSAITELYPEAIFLPIETTGDGAVNVYSRVQMMLFKANKAAHRDVEEVLAAYEMSLDEVKAFAARFPLVNHPLFKAPHRWACTAADTVELVGALKHPIKGLKRWASFLRHKPKYKLAQHRRAEQVPSPGAPPV